MSHYIGRSSRDSEHWMGHATTWSEHLGEAQTQLCRGYCLQSTKTVWRPLVPLVCHLQGKFRQLQYRTRTSESIVFNSSPLLVLWIEAFVVLGKIITPVESKDLALMRSSFNTNHHRESEKYTLMLMQWGQFVDHDITHTPTVRGEDETGIQCCSDEGETLSKRDRHRACFPIDIPDNDRMFSKVTQWVIFTH